MSGFVDLHMHTTRSDGILSPLELLEEVRGKNLEAFSITDHDTISGYLEVRELLTANDPELVPGVELSTTQNDNDLHLLVYCFDPENESLCTALDRFRANRNQRAGRMVEKLNSLGVPIRMNQVEAAADGAAIGRPHIAQVLVENNIVADFDEAFSRFLGRGKVAYIPKQVLTPREAINLGHTAGGVVIMAHPILDRNDRYIEELAGEGLDGIEIMHPYHKPAQTAKLCTRAGQLNLLVSGGSDFHGREGRYGGIGCKDVPVEYLNKIKHHRENMRDSI